MSPRVRMEPVFPGQWGEVDAFVPAIGVRIDDVGSDLCCDGPVRRGNQRIGWAASGVKYDGTMSTITALGYAARSLVA